MTLAFNAQTKKKALQWNSRATKRNWKLRRIVQCRTRSRHIISSCKRRWGVILLASLALLSCRGSVCLTVRLTACVCAFPSLLLFPPLTQVRDLGARLTIAKKTMVFSAIPALHCIELCYGVIYLFLEVIQCYYHIKSIQCEQYFIPPLISLPHYCRLEQGQR